MRAPPARPDWQDCRTSHERSPDERYSAGSEPPSAAARPVPHRAANGRPPAAVASVFRHCPIGSGPRRALDRPGMGLLAMSLLLRLPDRLVGTYLPRPARGAAPDAAESGAEQIKVAWSRAAATGSRGGREAKICGLTFKYGLQTSRTLCNRLSPTEHNAGCEQSIGHRDGGPGLPVPARVVTRQR